MEPRGRHRWEPREACGSGEAGWGPCQGVRILSFQPWRGSPFLSLLPSDSLLPWACPALAEADPTGGVSQALGQQVCGWSQLVGDIGRREDQEAEARVLFLSLCLGRCFRHLLPLH